MEKNPIMKEHLSMFSDEDLAEITDLLKNKDFSGWFKSNEGGHYLQEFQDRFATFCGADYAFAVSSGSASIYTALRACGVRKGYTVIVPAYTHIGSVAPILLAGATPWFVDVDKYGNMDPEKLDDYPGKAVIVVHQLGLPCEMDRIKRSAGGAFIIEDASHALGAEYRGRKAGVLGFAGCFSVGGGRTKIFGTGEGGMIVTDSDELAKRCKNIRNHGDRNFNSNYFCFNFRMSDLNAAVGLMQIKKLELLINWQVDNAEYLIKRLPDYLEVPPIPSHIKSVRYLIGCYFNEEKAGMTRDDFLQIMKKKGYQKGPRWFIGGGYSKLISDVKFYKRYGSTDLSMSKRLIKESVWIDFHRFPRSKKEIDELITVLNEV